jgi:hypothetical protein
MTLAAMLPSRTLGPDFAPFANNGQALQRVRASSDLRQIPCPYGEFLSQIVALRYRFEEKPSILGRWTTSRSDLMGLRGMSEEGLRAPGASANPEGGRPQTR